MIYTALNYITQELNKFLRIRFSEQSTKAILGSVLNESGVVPEENKNKIILTVVNLEYESKIVHAISKRSVENSLVSELPPFNFNLDVLATAMFSNYSEALKFLSETIYFFQAKQEYSQKNSSGLDPAIERFTIEIVPTDNQEMHNLWTGLGAKYMPSILLKIRRISFQSKSIGQLNPAVIEIDNTKQ